MKVTRISNIARRATGAKVYGRKIFVDIGPVGLSLRLARTRQRGRWIGWNHLWHLLGQLEVEARRGRRTWN